MWHYTPLNAGSLNPTGYCWIPESLGQGTSNASGVGSCKHATGMALPANLSRTCAVAIPGTVPNGDKMAASLPLHYRTQRPSVHTVHSEVIPYLLQHLDHKKTTGAPTGVATVVEQLPLQWLKEGLNTRWQHAQYPFWFARATSDHSDALLHKADWAASQDTALKNTPPGPSNT